MRPSTADVRVREERDEDATVGCSLAEFKLLGELGKGAYGTVYRVISLRDGKEYVLKKIPIKHLKKTEIQDVVKEAKILRKVDNQYIIKSFSHFVEGGALNIVMEYAEGGDLQKYIKNFKKSGTAISESEVWRIADELSQALVYLHDNKIIHRDVKTLNVFLTKDNRVKLGDMGVSKIVKNALAAQNTRVGTPLYLSPELVKQKPYDYKIDVWAMGCILYQMCTGKAPFTGENLISLGYSIVHNQPPTIPSTYSTELSEIVMKLLEKNPAKRPSSAEAFTLVGQYRKHNKQGSILNLKPISSKAQLSEAGEKKQITTYGNGVHALVDKEDLANPDHPAIDGGEKKPKEILKSSSPRRTKLARVLGKTDSKNLNLMNAHLKKESMHQFHQEREADNFSRVQSQLLHVSNAGASKKQVLDSSDQNIKQSDLGLFKDKSNIDSQANLEILKPRISPSEVDLSRENQKGNRVSQRSEKPAHEKVQTSSYEAHPPTIPQNHSANYIRPVRNIQSAYGENKHSGNKLIVNSKKMPDKIKCIELMLKRAILNDPVHNMLKGNQQSANNLNNPYSPPLPTSKSPSSGFEKQLSKEYKESVNEPKTGKITMGSLPTGGLELIEKAKIYQNEGATQEGTTSSQNLICHPFIDPFKKHVATPIGNKSDGRFLQKETVQTSENIEAPRREMYRAKMRPQTASANLHSRPNSAYSGVTGGALGNSKERITEGQPLLTDNRNYRIKTAVGSSKKDVPQANVGYSKQPVYYADKKVTIHDL